MHSSSGRVPKPAEPDQRAVRRTAEARDPPPISCSTLDTEGLSAEQSFEAWRASIAPLFDCAPATAGLGGFRARAVAFDLGSVILAESRASGQTFARSRALVRREGLDHFLVQWYRDGGYHGDHAGGFVAVEAGEIGILDLGSEFSTETIGDSFQTYNVFIPRDVLLSHLRRTSDPRRVRLSPESALGRILASHLQATWQELPRASQPEAAAIAESLASVVAAAVDGQGSSGDPAAGLDASSVRVLCDFIDANLAREDLGVDLLCRNFRCSRSYVYRLFREMGGVLRYIQERRLLRIHRELTTPNATPLNVSEVAYAWGFRSHSHLSQRFRERFAMTPSDARALAREQAARAQSRRPRSRADSARNHRIPEFRDWFRRLAVD